MPAARRNSPAPRGPGVRITAPRLVGRHGEYELLRAAVEHPGSVTVVEGESGVGKTRLLAEVLPDLAATGRRILAGGCRHLRDPLPLSPVVEALRSVGDALVDTPLSPVTGALRPLLPELSDVLPEPPPPLDDRRAEQHRQFRGLVDVLDSLGSTVLVLEDLHWADTRTVDFLNYLLGVPQPKLAVVLTFRGEQVDPSVRAVTARLPIGVRHEHVELAPLDAGRTGELAAAILGLADLSDEFAAYLCERASGLPFAIEELLALLRSRGDLAIRGGEWARRAIEELDVPRGIADQVRERVSVLSDGARRAVEAAAVLQVAVPTDAVVTTAGGDSGQVLRGVSEAVAEGLLASDGDRVGFRHVLAAQATYEGIVEPYRRDLHARAAVALETVDPVPMGLVAHHLHRAGLVAQWVDAAERAAERAIELGDDDEAVRLLRDVLCDAPLDSARRGEIAVRLARAAVDTLLDAAELIELLTDVLEHQELPTAARGELRFRLGILVSIAGGDPAVQRRFYLDAIDDLNDRPDLKAWAMTVLAAPMVPDVPLSEQLDWVHRALDVIPDIDDAAFEVFLLGKVAMVLAPTGDPAGRDVVRQIIERTAAEVSRRELNACYSAGFAACYVGRHETAGLLLTRALDGSTANDSQQLAARAGSALAVLDYCRGRWEGLRETADRLDDHHPDHAVIRVNVEVVRGCLALPRGDLSEAEERLSAAARLAESNGAFDLLPLPVGALIRLLLARGRTSEARAVASRYFDAVEPIGVWAPVPRALSPAVEAQLAEGTTSQAQELVERWTDRLADLDAPLAPAALFFSRGVVDASNREWPLAARRFDAAAEAYDALGCPYEAAQALERSGAAHHECGDRAVAASRLRAALDGYRYLGATWDVSRAARLAREVGVAVPSRHRAGRRGYGNELSPRELEVAELVATGCTNKEIGADLFISVSTVEKHLRSISRKLDVHSRTGIARWVSDTASH